MSQGKKLGNSCARDGVAFELGTANYQRGQKHHRGSDEACTHVAARSVRLRRWRQRYSQLALRVDHSMKPIRIGESTRYWRSLS